MATTLNEKFSFRVASCADCLKWKVHSRGGKDCGRSCVLLLLRESGPGTLWTRDYLKWKFHFRSSNGAEIVAFCIGFCTHLEGATASGLASIPRRNRRFLHRVLHASRSEAIPLQPPPSPSEALRSIETLSARGARKSAVFAALFRAPCPQVISYRYTSNWPASRRARPSTHYMLPSMIFDDFERICIHGVSKATAGTTKINAF